MSAKRFIRLKEFSPLTRFIRIPPSSYYETRPRLCDGRYYYFHTDSDGFIYNKIDNVFDRDLILIGGSSVENLFVDADKRVVKYLEDFMLDIDLEYNLKNAGTSGASLLHIINIIVNKIVKKKNPVVFLFIPSNDSSILNLHDSYWNIDKLNSNLVGVENKRIISKNKIHTFEKILQILISICKASSIELFIFNTIRFKEKDSYRMIDSATENICKKNNVKFTNVNQSLKDESFFYDDVHLNAKGSYQLAKILKKFCEKELRTAKTSSYIANFNSEYRFLKFSEIKQKKTFDINSVSFHGSLKGCIHQHLSGSDKLSGYLTFAKIYSKYQTFLVFNTSKNIFELVKKTRKEESQHVVHVKDGMLFFLKNSEIYYINNIFDYGVDYSTRKENNNYKIEFSGQEEVVSVRVNDLYLSASNLMNIKLVAHKKTCEIFTLPERNIINEN